MQSVPSLDKNLASRGDAPVAGFDAPYKGLYQTFILSMVPEMSVLFFSLPP